MLTCQTLMPLKVTDYSYLQLVLLPKTKNSFSHININHIERIDISELIEI
jgi:hypothetical protein